MVNKYIPYKTIYCIPYFQWLTEIVLRTLYENSDRVPFFIWDMESNNLCLIWTHSLNNKTTQQEKFTKKLLRLLFHTSWGYMAFPGLTLSVYECFLKISQYLALSYGNLTLNNFPRLPYAVAIWPATGQTLSPFRGKCHLMLFQVGHRCSVQALKFNNKNVFNYELSKNTLFRVLFGKKCL